MTQITEIDDPRIVKGLAHPLRIHILRVLQERTASPSEIAADSEASLGTISYHVRYLERVGLIELTSTRARRGAVEHYYRAVGRLRITDRAWAQLPDAVRESLLGSTLDQIGRVVSEAAAEGGFSRSDTHVARHRFTLDGQGFSELSKALTELADQAHRIESESARRMAADNHREPEIASTMILMLFDHASPTPDGEAPDDATPDDAAPDDTAPDDAVPETSIPTALVPAPAAPEAAVSGALAPAGAEPRA